METARKGRCCFADDIQRPILWWHAVSTSTCNIGMLFTHVKGPFFLAQTFIFTDSPMHLLKWEMRCLQKNVFLHFLLNLNFQLNFIHANNLCLNVKIDCCCLSYRSSTCRRAVYNLFDERTHSRAWVLYNGRNYLVVWFQSVYNELMIPFWRGLNDLHLNSTGPQNE